MELLLHWIREHGFDLLGAGGIVASLSFTGLAFRKDEQARHVSNLLAIVAAHREIWSELYSRPELARVLDARVNVALAPVTTEEALFVSFLLNHLNASFQAAKAKMFAPVGAMEHDIRSFFSLPTPRAVWEKSRALQDEDFVAFVEDALNQAGGK